MNEQFITNSVGFNISSKCTLRCKLCSAGIPLYKSPSHTPFEIIKEEIERIFELYDFVNFIDILGGEPLLHPNLPAIMTEFDQYKNQYKRLRIVTNGTIVPTEELLYSLKLLHGFEFLIDDYGAISTKVKEIEADLRNHQIAYYTNVYYGEGQHCNGWVDMGDFCLKGYTPEQYVYTYAHCHAAHWMCLTVRNGFLYHCATSMIGDELGLFDQRRDEKICLVSQKFNLREARNSARRFGANPITACQYCNGFDTKEAVRYPAAEQIK